MNGIYFAKSKYALYDSLDFTKSGNIVSFIDKKEIIILNGSDLQKSSIQNMEDKDNNNFGNINEKINGSSWASFIQISRRNEIDKKTIKCLTYTYFTKEKNKETNFISFSDVTDFKEFD